MTFFTNFHLWHCLGGDGVIKFVCVLYCFIWVNTCTTDLSRNAEAPIGRSWLRGSVQSVKCKTVRQIESLPSFFWLQTWDMQGRVYNDDDRHDWVSQCCSGSCLIIWDKRLFDSTHIQSIEDGSLESTGLPKKVGDVSFTLDIDT